jgi:hypothetical protein
MRTSEAFSEDGKVITDFVTRNGWNPSVALTKDGSIVAAGSDFAGAGILVSRYRADGTPDPTFDVDGVAVIDLPGPGRGLRRQRPRPGTVAAATGRRPGLASG